MNYEIDIPEELVEFFNDVFDLFDTGFTNRESMLKHVLLEGIEHRLEHIAHNQSVDQHTKYHNIINEEKSKCFSA